MCLGVPGQVLEVDRDLQTAVVDFWGVKKEVRLELCDAPVSEGDYILNHVGFAIRRIPGEEVAETLALYDELLRAAEAEDLMTADVRAEIKAAPDVRSGQQGERDASD
ncbi:MAG: HypC/HybG/HupF family hydrogenase formation chaperone [Polyangiales bacterium]